MSAKHQPQAKASRPTTTALPLYSTNATQQQSDAGFTGNVADGPFVDAGVYRYERDRKSHEFFSPGPHSSERTVKAPSAIFNLASTIIGGGILSLPYAFEKCGIVLAFVFMLVSAMASNFSLYVIVSCSRRGGATTYEEIVRKALGPKAGLITVTLLVLLTFLTMVAYVILVKDLVSSLGEQFLFARAISVVEQNVLTIVCIALVSPVLFARSMDALRYTSIFSLCSVFLLAIAITIRAVKSLESPDGNVAVMNTEPVSIKLFPSDWRDPVFAFPIISISFLCHFNVLPVYRELHKPTRHRLKKIVSATMFSTWAFYMVVATMGYLFAYQLPGGVKDDILNNFTINDSLINVGRLGLLMTIMMNLPLIMQPCRMNTIRLGKYVSGFIKTYSSRSSYGEDIALLTTPTAMQAVTPAVPNQNVFHFVLTVLLISGAVSLALVLPGVAVVWNMVGSTVGILISYVLPCVSYILIRKNRENMDRRKVTAWSILVVSSIMCVACTLQAFKLI
ncbi:hypothetical protein Gpo141_00007156 [Globisporangium polare]